MKHKTKYPPKGGVKNCKFRKGDIVSESEGRGRKRRIGVVVETWAWFLIKNCIDVRFEGNSGTGSIVDIEDLKLVKKREEVKNYWWKYIF